MRIVMISDVYFPRVNGVSTSIRTFRRELEGLGHEVLLIAPDYGAQRDAGDEESWILRVPARTVYVDPEDRMMSFSAVMALEQRLRELQPDLIHIQTPFVAHYAGVRLARRMQIPAVLTYHTYFEEYLDYYIRFVPRSLLRWSVRHLTRRQCSQVDSVVVPTRAFSEVLEAYGVRTECYINPTGVDLSRFTQGDGERFKRRYGIDPDRPCVLFVGRLVQEKNIGFLLQVVARVKWRIPDILFILAGEGPAEAQLRDEGRRLGLAHNLCFIGNIKVLQELLDCYCAGDAFVFASRTETQGLVLLEAMALGVPVVSTAKMGTRDILSARRGALVVEEDVAEFAAEVERLLDDKALQRRLGQEGRLHAAAWSAAAMAMRLEEVYLETVDSAFFFGQPIGCKE